MDRFFKQKHPNETITATVYEAKSNISHFILNKIWLRYEALVLVLYQGLFLSRVREKEKEKMETIF